MKKTDIYNNVSPSLLAPLKLKRDQTVTYRISPVPDDPFVPGKKIFPSAVSVPAADQIWDEEKQEYVEIAAISRIDPSGNHDFYDITFWGTSQGYLVLNGSIAAHQEIHSYLSLCNYNQSNPNRDPSKSVIFTLIDESKNSENERKLRNYKREALNIAADLSADDVRTYIAALGQDDTRSLEILRNVLETIADRDPKSFLDLVNNKQATMKAIINRALIKGIIMFNVEQSRFDWPNGEVILTSSRTTGQDAIDDLIAYCVSNAKGEKVYQTIVAKSKK